uniref:Uncharacterized protein n=1 Tax=Arundo donax TaxID=35708 RepID=A0A0A8ZWL5_ARUDO
MEGLKYKKELWMPQMVSIYMSNEQLQVLT